MEPLGLLIPLFSLPKYSIVDTQEQAFFEQAPEFKTGVKFLDVGWCLQSIL